VVIGACPCQLVFGMIFGRWRVKWNHQADGRIPFFSSCNSNKFLSVDVFDGMIIQGGDIKLYMPTPSLDDPVIAVPYICCNCCQHQGYISYDWHCICERHCDR
jgi:hypothetical protein